MQPTIDPFHAIENIQLDHKSRDDLPILLIGLQHLYTGKTSQKQLCDLLVQELVPNSKNKLGGSGMTSWLGLVLGVLMPGLDCKFFYIHDLVNNHRSFRNFLGHSDIGDETSYSFQTVVDNISLVPPELLAAVGKLVVASGHRVSRKKSWLLIARVV